MSLLRVCRKPAVTVPPSTSVKTALEVMTREKVGAVVIAVDGKAKGILTRRDAIERVILKELPLDSTEISAVMTEPVEVLPDDIELADALKVMATRPFNHIPVVDSDLNVVGLATTKPCMKRMIERLSDELGSLESYMAADGIGG